MMEHWAADQQPPNGLGITHSHHPQEQAPLHALPAHNNPSATDQFQQFLMPQRMHEDMFDSPLELNRRTLTQEHFDAFERNGGIMNSTGGFEEFQTEFSDDQEMLNQVFPQFKGDFKQQDVYAFPHPAGAPLSSNDSTVPSTISEHSMPAFQSSAAMQHQGNMSANNSEWTDSRSSSIHEGVYAQMAATQEHQQSLSTSSQWQPGQSIPVDFTALSEEFRQAAQAAQARASEQQHEQPLAWPDDDAYTRRDSQTSLLTHSFGNVGIQTPHPQQPGTFKSPPPPSSIAARRQRPRPAALGLASLRSQSCTGGIQPGSPVNVSQQQGNINSAQPLRRIRSSNVIGGVAQGRVMKSVPGSAQRSPLNWTFTDALNSPHVTRHASFQSQNLAPPTPMSPHEFPRPEQSTHFPQYQTASGHVDPQPSISETDFEHYHPNGLQCHPSMLGRNFSSPPHTPHYYQQQFVQMRMGPNAMSENTPPQSAPASQTCFPNNVFGTPQHQLQPQPQPQPQQQMQPTAMPQPQMVMNAAVPDQQFQMSNVTFAPTQQANVTVSGPPPGMPLQFANGVPMVNSAGDIQMAFPAPHIQLMQQQQAQSQPQQTQASYPFVTSTGGSPTLQGSQPSKVSPQPAMDFFVHEYTPPDAVKRAAIPRKPIETGPKNYTFSHTGMEHFEEKRTKKGDSKEFSGASSSPASSIGNASNS